MNHPPNPYEAPHASLMATDQAFVGMPWAMTAALACYVIGYLLEVLPLLGTPVSKTPFFMPMMVTLGTYTMAMTFALWRRWRWARVWIVLTTVISAFFLVRMLWRGASLEHWHAYLAAVLRIAVAVALLLPSTRRWFSAAP